MTSDERPFEEDDIVLKVGGGYQGYWNIRSVFTKIDGTVRISAESIQLNGTGLPGMLHIFSPDGFELVGGRRYVEERRPAWRPPTDPESDPMRPRPGPMA